MKTATDMVLLRIFLGEDDRYQDRCLYEAIIDEAFKQGLAGGTVLPGPDGYGHSRIPRAELYIDAGPRSPVIVEIVDTEPKIDGFLPIVDQMIETGLVTLERVKAIRFERPKPGNAPATHSS